VKRAALYMRVSSLDQHPETQLLDLRQMAAQRGYAVVQEYTDRISGAKARRPGLDQLMYDARRGKFDIVLVWASDRIARSTRHFLEVLDELNRLGVKFASFREPIDTDSPLGRALVVIIGAIAELERNLIIERVRAGIKRLSLCPLPIEFLESQDASKSFRSQPHMSPKLSRDVLACESRLPFQFLDRNPPVGKLEALYAKRDQVNGSRAPEQQAHKLILDVFNLLPDRRLIAERVADLSPPSSEQGFGIEKSIEPPRASVHRAKGKR
jgi:hypothetical protein